MQVVYFALFSLVCEHDAGRDAGHVMSVYNFESYVLMGSFKRDVMPRQCA